MKKLLIIFAILMTLISCNDKENIILDAIYNNNINKLSELIENGLDVNYRIKNRFNNTLLIESIISKNLNVTQFLLEHGANINMENGFNDTPLLIASNSRNLEMLNLLFKYPIDLEKQENTDSLPNAVSNNYKDIVKFLIKNGLNPNKTNALEVAILEENIEMTKLLIDMGADIYATDCNNNTLLWQSVVVIKSIKMSDFLLKLGIKQDCIIEDSVISNCSDELIQLLIENGCKVNCYSKSGSSPLLSAVDKNNLRLVKLLLKNGASTNQVELFGDNKGLNPIELAKKKNYNDILKLLLKYEEKRQ